MKCNCQTPTAKCEHAREKVIGVYCSLDFTKQGEVEIGSLRYGDQFSFKETPWLIKTVTGSLDNGIRYRKECGHQLTENNLKRIVDKV